MTYNVGDVVWVALENTYNDVIYCGPAKIIIVEEPLSVFGYTIKLPVRIEDINIWNVRPHEIKYIMEQ